MKTAAIIAKEKKHANLQKQEEEAKKSLQEAELEKMAKKMKEAEERMEMLSQQITEEKVVQKSVFSLN